jgi:hypothetical protein
MKLGPDQETKYWGGGMTQIVEYQPSKCKAMSSGPSTTPKKKKKEEEKKEETKYYSNLQSQILLH